MTEAQPHQPIGDLLHELVLKHKPRVSRVGLSAIVIVILTAVMLSAFVWRIIVEESERDETASLFIAGESTVTAFEERLNSLSVKLDSLTTAQPSLICNLLGSVFATHPELSEFSIINSRHRVLGNCANPDAMGEITRPEGSLISDYTGRWILNKILEAKSSMYSEPYYNNASGGPFVDLAIPTENFGLTFLARVSLPAALREAAQSNLNRFQHYHLLQERRFVTNHQSQDTPLKLSDLAVILPLPPLPPTVELGLSSLLLSSLYTNGFHTWTALGLLCVLLVTILLLLRYQLHQMQTEQSMRARILVQQAVSDSFLDGLCVLDKNGKILYANETFERLFALKDSPLGLTPPYPYWPPEDKVLAKSFMDVLYARRPQKERFEFEALRTDRTRFDCELHIFPLIDNQGDRLGFLSTYSNITQANRAQRELRGLQLRFTRVLESMDAAVCVVTRASGEPEMLFSNTAYTEQFGSSVQGHELLRNLLNQQPPKRKINEVLYPKNNRWYAAQIKPIVWIDEQVVEFLTAYDITEQHEAEVLVEQQIQKAELSSKLINMGEMASSLAHELNQPLAALQNYAAAAQMMLQAGKLGPHQTGEALEKILTQAKRASHVMQRIRGFAKRSDAQIAPAKVLPLAEDSVELAKIAAQKCGVELRQHVEPNLPDVLCDTMLIVQVLVNLMKNAIEASETSEKKLVVLDIAQQGSSVLFQVIDNGPGIQHPDRLFQPFYSTKATGMGIGLNLCRSIIESHQGHLSFRPNPDGGAIFSFALPIQEDSIGAEASSTTNSM